MGLVANVGIQINEIGVSWQSGGQIILNLAGKVSLATGHDQPQS
jgi:hypothetical protein